jgi:hypothetical protein
MALFITKPCIRCGEITKMDLPVEVVMELRLGTAVQDAMPGYSADDRELALTGTHPDCWDLMFGLEDCGE